MDQRFDVVYRDGTVTVFFGGDLDLASRDFGESAVARALALEPIRLLLDLSHVTFMDSCGLTVLLRAQRAAETAGVAFSVVGPLADEVQRVLTITGLEGLLERDAAQG
jgi:anti-sigma B factor antagonist